MVMAFSYKDKVKPGQKITSLGGLGVTFKIPDVEVKRTKKNCMVASNVLTYTVARALSYIAIDLLSVSLPRTPRDTGQLRESGRAVLGFGVRSGGYVDVGKGVANGTVQAMMSKVTNAKVRKAKKLTAHVQYLRFNKRMQDISLWAHETLRPYEERDFGVAGYSYARTEYTGPKYLELPWVENKIRYESILKQAILQDSFKNMRGILKTIKAKTGDYGVDQVELVESQIDRLGYFNRLPLSSKATSGLAAEMTLSQMHAKNR